MTIGGEHRLAGGETIEVTQPHPKDAMLGRISNATATDARAAVATAKEAAPGWRGLAFEERAAVLLKAAELDVPKAALIRGRSRPGPEVLGRLPRRYPPPGVGAGG